MYCSSPGSSVHEILQAGILEWVTYHFLLQGTSLTQGLNGGVLCFRQILYNVGHKPLTMSGL